MTVDVGVRRSSRRSIVADDVKKESPYVSKRQNAKKVDNLRRILSISSRNRKGLRILSLKSSKLMFTSSKSQARMTLRRQSRCPEKKNSS